MFSSQLVTVVRQVRGSCDLSIHHVLTLGTFIAVLISIDQNPSNFSVFNTSTSGVELPLAVDFFDFDFSGQLCIPVDIASLNIPGVAVGSNITLQVMQVSSKYNLFQVSVCASNILSYTYHVV